MATADIRRARRKSMASPEAAPPKPRRRVFRWGFLLLVIALGTGVYFAPQIAGKTIIGGWIVDALVPLDGTITFDATTLDWFQPVVIDNLQIHDADGEQLLTVERIASEQPLVAMLLNLADLGKLHISRPLVRVIAYDHDSNLERVLAPLMNLRGGGNVRAQLDITEGTLILDDSVAERSYRCENLSIDCALPNAQDGITLHAAGVLASEKRPGSFKIDLTVSDDAGETADDAPLSMANGKIDCDLGSLPLGLVEPLARRLLADTRLRGLLSARFHGAWGSMAERGDRTVSGEAIVTGFDFTAAALGGDHVQLERLDLPCRIVQDDDWIQVEQLGVISELGELNLVASVKLADFSAPDKLAALARESCELKGNLNLARLAPMLPATLRLREGTEVTSGEITLSAATRPHGDSTQWTASVTTSPLAAKVGGRVISWDNPLSIELAATESSDGFLVERVDCTSSFIEASGHGTFDNWTASADFDLARMVAELKKFCDLGPTQISGHGQAQLVWKRERDDRFSTRGEFQARGFQWILPHARPWSEDNLVMTLDASGRLRESKIQSIEQAQLTASAGNERAEINLREPITDLAAASFPLGCSWSGELAHWAPRLESGLGISAWDLAGAGTLQSNLTLSRRMIEFADCHADFTRVEIRGHGYHIVEPAVELVADGKLDLAGSRVELVRAELTAGVTAANLSHVVFERGPQGMSLAADGNLVADLDQIARWLTDPRSPAALEVAGKLTGEVHFKQHEGVTSGQVQGAIDRLYLAARSSVPDSGAAAWEEDHLPFLALVNYQPQSQQLRIEKLQLVGDALRCDTSGTLGTAAEGADVELKGTVQYDWERLAPLWQAKLGPRVQIAGKQTREFTVRGPLAGPATSLDSWREVSVDAVVGWTGMDIYGLLVGRGDVHVRMADGQLRTEPIDVMVSEGRLTLAPLVRLNAKPADIVLARGPLLTDVHLSRELCQRGLRFITPVLADSTVADGRFSIVLEGGRIPLADPTAGDVAGRMAMRAQAHPGPVARQFLVLVRELTAVLQRGRLQDLTQETGALVSIDESNIEFRCVNRRVYHRGLRFTVGATPITTYGWVGFDDTLGVIAEVPVQAKLFGIDLSLGALEGQVLQIPISGTLDDPQLDKRAVTQLTGRMLENTARGVLIDGVQKQLERLLPGKP